MDKARAAKLLVDAEEVTFMWKLLFLVSTTSTIHQVYYVTIDQVIPELVALAKRHPSLRDGALAASLEEYVEAKCLGYYLDHQRLLPRRDVPVVQKNEYLGGVIDFTGETVFGRCTKTFCL